MSYECEYRVTDDGAEFHVVNDVIDFSCWRRRMTEIIFLANDEFCDVPW